MDQLSSASSTQIIGTIKRENKSLVFVCQKCNEEFNTCDELEEHFIDEETGIKRLRHMPTELLEKIFQFLPPTDLANISLTNRKFKYLAEDYFLRKYDTGRVCIYTSGSDGVRMLGEFYERRFCSAIKNVTLRIHNWDLAYESFQFLHENCAQKLHRLSIELPQTMRRSIINCYGLISPQLKTLKVLVLQNVNRTHYLLRYCESLKVLFIGDFTSSKNDLENVCVTESYSSLKVFIMEDKNNVPHDLTTFFENNPQLKIVALNCKSAAKNLFDNTTLQLSYAIFQFFDEQSFQPMWRSFRQCCDQNRIAAVDLSFFNCPNIALVYEIFRMQCVKGFHGRFEFLPRKLNTNIKYRHIERLCFRIQRDGFIQADLDAIFKYFPNLHELRLGILYDHDLPLFEILLAFARQPHHFNRIHVLVFTSIKLKKDEVHQLSAARLASGNVSPLSIFIRQASLDGFEEFNSRIRIGAIEIIDEFLPCLVCDNHWTEYGLFRYLKCIPQMKPFEGFLKTEF